MGCTMRKIAENKEIPLAILSRILAQSCVTPPYIIQAKGLHMIVLVSLIVLLEGFPCFHDFSHGASRPYIPIYSVERLLHLYIIMYINRKIMPVVRLGGLSPTRIRGQMCECTGKYTEIWQRQKL